LADRESSSRRDFLAGKSLRSEVEGASRAAGDALLGATDEQRTPPEGGETLRCWDFGGQNIYHATHQFFLTTRSMFLLAWNARLGWEQGKLHYWLDTIQALAPDSPVLLVATHIDERPGGLPLDDLIERYPQIVGEWSVSNAECDLNDNGIDRLRENIAVHAKELPLMGSGWPFSYQSGLQDAGCNVALFRLSRRDGRSLTAAECQCPLLPWPSWPFPGPTILTSCIMPWSSCSRI
jgi:hypothetical protein